MTQIKYTKTELRQQQIKLTQLEKYLPTLRLKKAMLQLEINQVIQEHEQGMILMGEYVSKMEMWNPLLTDPDAEILFDACKVQRVDQHIENIAGVEIPLFDGVDFQEPTYFLFDTPYWLEDGIRGMQALIRTREEQKLRLLKKSLLEKELREVSIRVNLFEKIMIPRTKENIKKIKIFLGDQQLAAVSQAKVSKRKILERKGKGR